MIGFAEIPAGARGQCSNTFSFTGNPNNKVTFALNLNGKFSGDFDLHSNPGIESWSPCGGSTAILNMNTACNLSPTHLPALIAVSPLSLPQMQPPRVVHPKTRTLTMIPTGRPHQRQAHGQVRHQVAPLPPQVNAAAYLRDYRACCARLDTRTQIRYYMSLRTRALGALVKTWRMSESWGWRLGG